MISLLSVLATITISVAPSVCHSPCTFVVTLQVEKAADNEKVVIVLEAEDSEYFRSSELPLNTQSPIRTVQIKYPKVPRGHYIIKATLYKHNGGSWIGGQDVKTIRIIGG